jgi:hypothetical protein
MHEMMTGHQPFPGATPMEKLLRIANIERPPFTPGPVGFRMLVDRCLARDPEKRFPHTGEIFQRLRRIREQLRDAEPKQAAADGSVPVAAQVIGRWWQQISPRVIVAVLSILALATLGVFVARWYVTPVLGDPLAYTFSPLASDSELDMFPAWSPNGRVVAYSADSKHTLQVFTRSLRSSLSTQVTQGAADCFFPSWSPDGTRIYYVVDLGPADEEHAVDVGRVEQVAPLFMFLSGMKLFAAVGSVEVLYLSVNGPAAVAGTENGVGQDGILRRTGSTPDLALGKRRIDNPPRLNTSRPIHVPAVFNTGISGVCGRRPPRSEASVFAALVDEILYL